LGLTFFGLTFDSAPQARAAIFTQIHEICFHGKGGYDWNTINIKDKTVGGKSKSMIDSSGKVNTPEFAQASQQYKKKSSYK